MVDPGTTSSTGATAPPASCRFSAASAAPACTRPRGRPGHAEDRAHGREVDHTWPSSGGPHRACAAPEPRRCSAPRRQVMTDATSSLLRGETTTSAPPRQRHPDARAVAEPGQERTSPSMSSIRTARQTALDERVAHCGGRRSPHSRGMGHLAGLQSPAGRGTLQEHHRGEVVGPNILGMAFNLSRPTPCSPVMNHHAPGTVEDPPDTSSAGPFAINARIEEHQRMEVAVPGVEHVGHADARRRRQGTDLAQDLLQGGAGTTPSWTM